MIDDSFDVVQFRGGTDRFLRHASGRASLNLLELAREGLAGDLRTIVEHAGRTGVALTRRARFRDEDGMAEVKLHVAPIAAPDGARYFLVLFESPDGGLDAGETADDASVSVERPATDEGVQAAEMRGELEATRSHMMALVDEKEAALEELRAANEEIQSSNEELQSINEELETAKEELQSTNEELRTVNEELEHRNRQLTLVQRRPQQPAACRRPADDHDRSRPAHPSLHAGERARHEPGAGRYRPADLRYRHAPRRARPEGAARTT